MEYRALHYSDVPEAFWSHVSWYYVGFGNKYEPLVAATKRVLDSGIYTKFHSNEYEEVRDNVLRLVEHCMDHRKLLNELGAKKWES
jgi:hypothetical protein